MAGAASEHPASGTVLVQRDVAVTMRDGIALCCDIYRPAGSGAAPVLVQRTPYDKSLYDAASRAYAECGYLVVIQDVRGQFASGGVFEPWVNEGQDGYDTIEWAAALEGCTGKVGTLGTSYQAAAQWQAARLQPPHLTAMVTPVTPADYYDQWVYPSGAFALSFNTTWLLNNVAQSAARRLPDGDEIATAMATAYANLSTGGFEWLPLRSFGPLHPDDRRIAPYFFNWLDSHASRDGYWDALSLRGHHGSIQVPVLNYEGWYDVFVDGGIENFIGMRAEAATPEARAGTRLVVGPYAHNNWGRTVGAIDFGPDAEDTFFQTTLSWFDHWLKGVGPGLSQRPAVRYFTMGTNTWNETDQWPPPGCPASQYYLHSELGANGLDGDGRLQLAAPTASSSNCDTYTYDPRDPVPSIGGNGCCYAPQSPMGPYDQRPVELRSDVLVYTTERLSSDIEITGTPTVRLWAASSARATDFTAKLVDVHPDGTAINVSGGVVRADMSDAFDDPVALTVSMSPTSIAFLSGHQIRIEISSSNFPLYDRNPNTGLPAGSSDTLVCAIQTVFHTDRFPSSVLLPVKRALPAVDGGRLGVT